mmetsp:Transcript_134932/g.200743  ORF Transcript_134932/g.200743 Transcript_134932/m.200743 type:complete len:271 (-) Transcript_134932:65-877(-)
MKDLKTLQPLCLLAILVGSSTAQSGFEDPVNFINDEAASCNDESSLLRSDPALQQARETITNQFQGMNVEDSCVRNGLEFACRVDYRTFESDLEEVCESLGGRYFERDHTIECPTANRKHILAVGNYPLCFGQDCKDADVDRLVASDIQDLEDVYSHNFEVTCTSKHDVDDGNVQCPDPRGATPEVCSSFKSETVGFLCDCYDFCDGYIYACDGKLVGEQTEACSRDFVSGCTFDLLAGRQNKPRSDGNASSLMLSYSMLALLALIGLTL